MDVFMDAACIGCTVLDFGDHALMLQCDSTADAMAWTDALRATALRCGRLSLRPRAPYWAGRPAEGHRRRLRRLGHPGRWLQPITDATC